MSADVQHIWSNPLTLKIEKLLYFKLTTNMYQIFWYSSESRDSPIPVLLIFLLMTVSMLLYKTSLFQTQWCCLKLVIPQNLACEFNAIGIKNQDD